LLLNALRCMRAQRNGRIPRQLQVTNPPSPTPERPVPPPAAHFFASNNSYCPAVQLRKGPNNSFLKMNPALPASREARWEDGPHVKRWSHVWAEPDPAAGGTARFAEPENRKSPAGLDFDGLLYFRGNTRRKRLWTNHARETEMKKGAGASPLFELTPQKPNPSRGSDPATPGSQSHVVDNKESNTCASDEAALGVSIAL
jgi:hypothetical protein